MLAIVFVWSLFHLSRFLKTSPNVRLTSPLPSFSPPSKFCRKLQRFYHHKSSTKFPFTRKVRASSLLWSIPYVSAITLSESFKWAKLCSRNVTKWIETTNHWFHTSVLVPSTNHPSSCTSKLSKFYVIRIAKMSQNKSHGNLAYK